MMSDDDRDIDIESDVGDFGDILFGIVISITKSPCLFCFLYEISRLRTTQTLDRTPEIVWEVVDIIHR